MNTTTTNTFEAHRPEPVPLTKMDTSLEHALNKHSDISLLSPSSATSEFLNSDRGCHHNKLVHYGNYDNCFHCGAYVSKTGSKTLISKKMSYVAFFPPKTIYETMTKRSACHKQSTNSEYSQVRHTYVEWVLEIADKLKISANSSHLAIMLLDAIMFKDVSLTSKIQLYAPVCLLIAAKTIELDERIPFIPRLRRYANPTFSVDEYRKAELHILDMVDWNAQFGTPIEISEFLMSQGVLFSTDGIEDNILSAERGKLSPEALRENNGNTNNYTEVKGEDKKDTGASSPSSKENNENCESSAGVEPAAVANAQQAAQQAEDVSPAAKVVIPVYHKQQSSPANFETNSVSVRKSVTSVEKKAGEIMSHFEGSYVKLSTMLIKDVEFVEWEPKVVAASMMAFFRCANRITPIWNGELEEITELKFVQISSCFDLIYKKYNTAFNPSVSKALIVINNNQEIPESKLARANTIAVEKAGFAQPKTELANKTNIINNALNTKPLETVLNDSKALERKQIFAYQAKANIPAANPATTAAYNNLRDDLRFRTKYANGTINTEIPQRNSRLSNYQTARYNATQEYAAGYYNNSANASFSTATASYSSAGGSLIDSSYVKAEGYPSRNPSISFLDHSAFENYQAKLKK